MNNLDESGVAAEELAENEPSPSPVAPRLAGHAAKIGKLTSIYLAGTVCERIVGLLLLPVFTHYLVPEQMGIVSLAGRFDAMLSVLLQFGLLSAIWTHYFGIGESMRSNYVRSIHFGLFLQTVGICAVLSLAGFWFADQLLPNLPLDTTCLRLLWLMIVWQCLLLTMTELASQVVRFQERAVLAAVISLVGYTLQAGLGVLAVVCLGWQGFGRLGAAFLAAGITAILALIVLWRAGSGRWQLADYKSTFRTGISYTPHSVAGVLGLALGGWLLNKMASPAALAIFGVASLFAMALEMPLSAFRSAAYPTLVELIKSADDESRRQHARLLTLLTAVILFMLLGVWLFAPPAILILTAPAYHSATGVVLVLVFAWLFQGLLITVQPPFFFSNKGLLLSSATILAAVVNIGLCIWLVPRWGVYGDDWAAKAAAWAVVGGYASRYFLSAWLSRRIYRVPYEQSKFLRLLFVTVVLSLAGLWVDAQLPLLAGIGVKAALLLLFVPFAWLLGSITTAEIQHVYWLVKQRLSATATPAG